MATSPKPDMSRPFKLTIHNKPFASYNTMEDAVRDAEGLAEIYGPGGVVIDEPLDFGDES